jgi:hypothetical protein
MPTEASSNSEAWIQYKLSDWISQHIQQDEEPIGQSWSDQFVQNKVHWPNAQKQDKVSVHKDATAGHLLLLIWKHPSSPAKQAVACGSMLQSPLLDL